MTAGQQTITTLQEENEQLRARLAALEAERDEAQHAYQQMYNVLMQAPTPIFLLRGDHLVYELANPAYLHMVQKGEVIGKSVREVFPELEGQGYFEVLEALHQSGESMVQQEFPARIDRGNDGILEEGWFNLVYQPIRNAQGSVDGILHLVVEVTDQVRARQQVEALNEALHKSRNLLQSVIDNSPSIIYAKDMEGHVILANQAFAAFTHLEPDSLMGKTDYDYFPPETAEQVRAFDQQVLAGGTVVTTQDRIPTDEGPLMYDTVKFPIRDEQGTIYALGGISTDITEQQRQQEDMRVFKAVMEAAPDGISFTRLDTGRISYANQAYREMFGYGDDIIGLSLSEVHDEKPEDLERHMQASIVQGALRMDISCKRKDGRTFLAAMSGTVLHNADGQPFIAAAILRDLTEQQQREADLRTFKTMADTAPDGFGIADTDGVITYANAAYRAMTGYGDELVGMRFIDHFSPQEQPEAIEAITETSTRGEWRGLLHFQRKDGSQIPVESTGFVMRDAQGTLTSVMGLFRDMTEQQRSEQERATLQQQVIEAQREALRELSTPLIPISDSMVIMPLIGTIDSQRAQMVMETLLEGVAQHHARLVILDITGVQVVDTQVAQAFIQAAQAVRLLGAQVMLTGIRPQIAQTLVQLGVDLSGIITRGSLQAGIADALQAANGHRKGVRT